MHALESAGYIPLLSSGPGRGKCASDNGRSVFFTSTLFRLPDRRSRYFLLFNFPCMHYFPYSDRSLKPSRKDAKTSPVIPSLLSLLNFPSTPRKMFLPRSNSNSSSFQSWNIWIQIFQILNSKYRGGRAKWRGKNSGEGYTCTRFEIPDRRRKIKFQFEFPYLLIYIHTHTHSMWIVDKFSLLSSRIEDRRRGTKQIARIDQISLVYKRSSGVKR